jgi:hypothetical protein
MVLANRRLGGLVVTLGVTLTLAVAGCAPASERPVRGAVPGKEGPTPAGLPPTLTASDALAARAQAAPSPADAPSPSPSGAAAASPGAAAPSPSAVATPSVVAAPPIVRTIAPSANGHVPAGAPVTLSAVLVGRGADLASASLSVNGADAGAEIDKRSPREWAIHTSQTLGNGPQTARVLVRDASGAAGGFTWQFTVGDDAPPAADNPAPKPSTSPQPKPARP